MIFLFSEDIYTIKAQKEIKSYKIKPQKKIY